MALNERQSITNELESETSGKRRLDKVCALCLEDFLVRRDAIHDERFRVCEVQISDERRVGELSGPFAEEFRKPRNFEELRSLTEEECIILSFD